MYSNNISRQIWAILAFMWFVSGSCRAQSRVLSIDECKEMAVANNKEVAKQRIKESIAKDSKEVAKTLYLPKFDLVGSYIHTSREISILNDEQKNVLNSLGSNFAGVAQSALPDLMTALVSHGVFTPNQAQGLAQLLAESMPGMVDAMNQVGGEIADAFHTDTRNMWVGAVTVAQPLYMGGRITAANKIADIGIEASKHQTAISERAITLRTEQAYWLVVSLKSKYDLAKSYCNLLRKLDDDVSKMVREGVATKADKLNVDVKVNEADMSLLQVEDGLALSKMALCQICGLPINSDIDVDAKYNIAVTVNDNEANLRYALDNREELKLLDNLTDIARQEEKIVKADYLPSVALTAGYMLSNPSLYNGFQRKFKGMWNVGITLQMPLWHWNDTKHKANIARSTTLIANMDKENAEELIALQVNQNEFKVKEAQKKLAMTDKNMESAEENLRSANMGFREGIFTATTVMEAQTAWLKASNQRIDAQIDAILSQAELNDSAGR